MSKTVKIPECMNPFEVFINGKHYSYPAGTTQEVPDDVAAVIEAHEQVHEEQTAPPPPTDGGILNEDGKINPSFLPGVCLPVVELSTTLESEAQYTEEECTTLTALFAMDVPVIIKCGVDLGTSGTFEKIAAVWNPGTSGNIPLFIVTVGGITLQIADITGNGEWIAIVVGD